MKALFCVSKQKTAYEMRISDWSSDVCSSDLDIGDLGRREMPVYRHGISADMLGAEHRLDKGDSIGEKDRDAAAGANARRGEQARGASAAILEPGDRKRTRLNSSH